MDKLVDKLEVRDLYVNVHGKSILREISFDVPKGNVVVLVGPNGAGKSTVLNALMGNPKYFIKNGKILLDREDITQLDSSERARKGLFMSFQHPVEISGVSMSNFLRQSYNSIKGTNLQIGEFMRILNEKMKILNLDSRFRGRFVNSGFSGGEKKRSEILQMILLEPEYVILDEIDSGLDVDSLKQVCEAIEEMRKLKKVGTLIITHYSNILEYLKPDEVIVLKDGRVSQKGGLEIAKKIFKEGFE